MAGLTRQASLQGKVAIGKAKYLLNIVQFAPGCSNHLLSEYIPYLMLIKPNILYLVKDSLT